MSHSGTKDKAGIGMRFSEICEQIWRPGYFAIAVAIVIAAGSLMPADDVRSLPGSGFIKHALPYAVLCFFAVLATRDRTHAGLVLVGVFVYGLLMEVIQPLFGRTFDSFDLIANAVGALLGLGAIPMFQRLISLVQRNFLPCATGHGRTDERAA